MACIKCGGSGYYPCPHCWRSTGYLRDRTPCPRCQGKGRLRCPTCKAAGVPQVNLRKPVGAFDSTGHGVQFSPAERPRKSTAGRSTSATKKQKAKAATPLQRQAIKMLLLDLDGSVDPPDLAGLTQDRATRLINDLMDGRYAARQSKDALDRRVGGSFGTGKRR